MPDGHEHGVEASRELTLEIEGMHCASCAQAVRAALERAPGVTEARVNFATHRATVVTGASGVDRGVLVPLAALGVVHPVLAAGAMGLSSVSVVGNSLRLVARRG